MATGSDVSGHVSKILLQILIAALFVVPVGLCGFWVWQKHQWGLAQLAQLEPRHARLLGLQSSAESLKQSLSGVQTQLANTTYPVSQDTTQAGNAAQQTIRALFADSKLDVMSIQVLPAKEQKGLDRIAVVVRVEGDLVGLHNAMAMLETQIPKVWVETMTLQTVGMVKPKSAQRLAAQFNLFVLRSRF